MPSYNLVNVFFCFGIITYSLLPHKFYILVKGVGKGTAVQRLIAALGARGRMPDFILCVGDDGSDEDMFKAISAPSSKSAFPEAAETFACTVGNKPSLAKYYLEDPDEVLKMLKGLMDSSSAQQRPGAGEGLRPQVSFDVPLD
jgi:trehalose 6-phosphate synthase/phosphatase